MIQLLLDMIEFAFPAGMVVGTILVLLRMPLDDWSKAIDSYLNTPPTTTPGSVWVFERVRAGMLALYGHRMRSWVTRSVLFNAVFLLVVIAFALMAENQINRSALTSALNALAKDVHPVLADAHPYEIAYAIEFSNSDKDPMESERQYIHQDARSVEIRAAISASTELRQERWAHHVWRHVQWFSQTRYCASRLVHLHVCYALYAFAGAVAINSLIDTGLLVLVMHYIKRKAIPSLVSVLAGATTLGLILYAMNVLVYLTMMTPRFEAGYSNLLSAGQFAKWLILVGVSVCLVRALWVGLEHRRRWIRLLAVSTAAVCAAVLLSPSVSSIGLWFGQLFKAARLDPSPAIPARQPWLLVNLPWVAAACGLLPTALTMLFATVAGALHLSLRAGHRVVAAAFLFCTRYMGGSIGVIVTLGSVLLWSIAKLIR